VHAIDKLVRTFRTANEASPTLNTTVGLVLDLLLRIYSLGIMAPKTTQRAAFKENGRSNARTIMNREPLDIKN
jgi:hypothetical protein